MNTPDDSRTHTSQRVLEGRSGKVRREKDCYFFIVLDDGDEEEGNDDKIQ